MHGRKALAYLALVAAAWLVPAGAALAGKPGGGGGGTPQGTIYFSPSDQLTSICAMDGGGGNRTTLVAGLPGGLTRASRLLHGGRRWFLRRETVPGESGPGGNANRMDFFAVREDGALRIRLTSDPAMDYWSNIGGQLSFDWAPDEDASGATISCIARRWTGTSSTDTVVPGSAGLYTADLVFDASGDIVGLAAEPTFTLSLGTIVWHGHEVADAMHFSWSPDMSRLVCDRHASQTQIRVVDAASGAATVIATSSAGAWAPDWSPDGSRIVYLSGNVRNDDPGVVTVSPTGSDRKIVFIAKNTNPFAEDSLYSPRWSPDSAWVAFTRRPMGSIASVYRVTASGASLANLTPDATENQRLWDWR